METIKPRKYGELAAEKIAKELKEFKGDRYGDAVKNFVASTLTNFCEQNERFAQVVYETEATLSDCCAKIMQKCGNHVSDIDVYRAAVRYYFPNAEVVFTMTIDATGDAPTQEQMAKPEKKQEPEDNTAQDAGAAEGKPKKSKRVRKQTAMPEKKKPEKAAKTAQEDKTAPKTRREPGRKAKKEDADDGLIQLTLF